jgi:hypothetical protein
MGQSPSSQSPLYGRVGCVDYATRSLLVVVVAYVGSRVEGGAPLQPQSRKGKR